MVETSRYQRLWRPEDRVAAPHAARLLAFGVDLIVVLLVAWVAGGGWPRVLGVFVAYHTALVWLTGQTIGKAIANLEVRRVDGSTFVRTARGLPWCLARASVGYLLVDVLGLGVLVALPKRNVARRCPHDWVFGSKVVLRGEMDWALPRMRERLSEFANDRDEASRLVQEKQGEPRRLSSLWNWLVTGALGLEKVIDVVQDVVGQVSHWFGGAGQTHGASTTLSSKAAVGVAVGCGAATIGAVVAVAMVTGPPAGASVVGAWNAVGGKSSSVVVEQSASGRYVGRPTEDLSKSTACVWKANRPLWRFNGAGPAFEGQVLWSTGTETECTGFHWLPATFELDDSDTPKNPADDTLRYCSTSPSVGERCGEYSRG